MDANTLLTEEKRLLELANSDYARQIAEYAEREQAWQQFQAEHAQKMGEIVLRQAGHRRGVEVLERWLSSGEG